MLEVEKAREEILSKTNDQINEETAWTWASRAAAAFVLSKTSETERQREEFRLRGVDLLHEALEHAALVGDDASFLQTIIDSIRQVQSS